MTTFTDEPLEKVIEVLRGLLGPLHSGELLSFYALDPDLGAGRFTGERLGRGGVQYRHRSLRVWLELAERLGCRLHTPEPQGTLVKFTMSKLGGASWHQEKAAGSEAYGEVSAFSRVEKLEEPTFLLDYLEAIERVALTPGSRVLNLGVGRGDELVPFESLKGHDLSFTGIDHSASALDAARRRFPEDNYRFIQADLNNLSRLGLGRFDLIVSIATFQSPGVAGHSLIRDVAQNYLTEQGSLILALPNCRYREGEVTYGARMKNFAQPELSLVIKDLAFYRKYLQQHRFRVFITGKYYLFLTALHA